MRGFDQRGNMGSDDNEPSISAIGDEVRGWVEEAAAVSVARGEVIRSASEAMITLKRRIVQARRGDQAQWHVLPLRQTDDERLRAIAANACLPVLTSEVKRELDRLPTKVAQATDDLRAVTGFGRLLLFGGTRDKARTAAQFLPEYRRWYLAARMGEAIKLAAPPADRRIQSLQPSGALDHWVGLASQLPENGVGATVLSASNFADLPDAVAVVRNAAAAEAKLRKAAVDAGNNVRNKETDQMLADMSVERLREATRDKLRVGALAENGITNVLAVLANEHRLERLPGIGETTAKRMRGAARTLRQNTYDEMPMRIDINKRTPQHTDFLRCLRNWDAARRAAFSPEITALVEELAPVSAVINNTVTHAIVVPAATSSTEAFTEAVRKVTDSAGVFSSSRATINLSDPWDDFLARPADYFALLAELGFVTEDEEKTHGDLSVEIIEAVREFELKSDHLTASLRGYQHFAARFALVQRKVIIGDEMGLGKTVEAIAVLAHLRAKGKHNFLVVCPAAVVTNWMREVTSKSKLAAHRLHGPDKKWAAKNWERNGGVGITTFETLKWLSNNVALPKLGCLVVDEAHYIKNPDAQRTRRTRQLMKRGERAILLTGTPLENRIDEFRNLVGYLRPDLVVDVTEFAPKRFRRQVAPAYLRRNQEDVLTELPELVQVEEWLELSSEDLSAYRDAVYRGNFMAARQAAMLQGAQSVKVQKLIEIVEEAEDNGRRVVVFSHFLRVLDRVAAALPGRVFGPLTGSVPAVKRQKMIDEFSAAQDGAVLVAQIQAGGVGLNIQAASVVVICEPQVKPTTEWQAIARAHRMGQLKSVQVHRLLSEEGVDQRLYQLLARKREIFEDFARQSETAESAPEAYDVSEAALAKEVIAAERERLFGRSDPTSFPSESEDEEKESGPSERTAAAITAKPTAPTRADEETSAKSATGETDSAPIMTYADSDYSIPIAERPSTKTGLLPYTVFSGTFPPLSETPADKVIENIICIVEVEGPLTGYRIHAAYLEASGDWESRANAKLLNQSISRAESQGLILVDNPLGAEGITTRTFRLPGQPAVIRREQGPRSLTQVPPAELGSQDARAVETSTSPSTNSHHGRQAAVARAGSDQTTASKQWLIPEPPNGSIIRFSKNGFHYVAVRCGDHWETSATASGRGFIDKRMAWDDVWAKGRSVEVASAWAEVQDPPSRDDRLKHQAIVRFVRDDKLVGAIAIDGAYRGFNNRLWYTTLSKSSGGKKLGSWLEILPNPQHVEVATGWESIDPIEVSQ